MSDKLSKLTPRDVPDLQTPTGALQTNPMQSTNGSLDHVLARYKRDSACVLLIDTSGSMSDKGKMPAAKSGASEFASSALQKGYVVAVVSFSDSPQHVIGFTKDRQAIEEAVSALEPQATTEMTWALQEAAKLLDGGTYRQRAIVVVTDGVPNNASTALLEGNKIKERGIDIITVGTGDADFRFLKKLASRDDLATQVTTSQLAAGIQRAALLLPPAR